MKAPVWILSFIAMSSSGAWADSIEDANVCYEETVAGSSATAIEVCTRAIEAGDLAEGDLIPTILNRGVAFKREGDLFSAIADYSRVIELSPDDAVAYTNRANARREIGLIDDALMDLNEAVRSNPDYAKAYYVRGAIYEDLREKDLAFANYERAHQLAPNNDEFRDKVVDSGATTLVSDTE